MLWMEVARQFARQLTDIAAVMTMLTTAIAALGVAITGLAAALANFYQRCHRGLDALRTAQRRGRRSRTGQR
jgi:hypothetical protein